MWFTEAIQSIQYYTVSRISTLTIRKSKRNRPVVALSTYDAITGALADEAGIDLVLVGDSVGTTLLGFDTTVPVTLEMMLHHTAAVSRGVKRALLVADIPFGEIAYSQDRLLESAIMFMQQGGAQAVKVEGGQSICEKVRCLVGAGIPVLGHIGLLPQSYYQSGGYRVYGESEQEREMLLNDAQALQDAGAFAIVAERIHPDTASMIVEKADLPIIGIGCDTACDGQIIVSTDLLGMTLGNVPPFVKSYANLRKDIAEAFGRYADDVRNGSY